MFFLNSNFLKGLTHSAVRMREKGNENMREGGKEKRSHRLNVEIEHEKIQLSGVFLRSIVIA